MISLKHKLYTYRARDRDNQSINKSIDKNTSIKNKLRMDSRVEFLKRMMRKIRYPLIHYFITRYGVHQASVFIKSLLWARHY